jgi:hypothetical protein
MTPLPVQIQDDRKHYDLLDMPILIASSESQSSQFQANLE